MSVLLFSTIIVARNAFLAVVVVLCGNFFVDAVIVDVVGSVVCSTQ